MIHLICPNPAIDRTLLLKTIEQAIPNRPIEIREFPGGKSFNVAYALSYTEEPPALMIHTMLGGIYGDYVHTMAKEKGYHLAITATNKNTRMCNILVDTTEKQVIPIYEYGFELNDHLLKAFTEKLLSSIQEDDLLVFSGSLMKGMPANYIAQIEKKLQQLNIRFKLCVDTSGKALVETYQHTQPFLIKINDEEIKDIFPEKKLNTPADYLDLLRNDVKKSIANFVITLGKEGIVARMNNQLYTGFAEPIEAKNPIACGIFF